MFLHVSVIHSVHMGGGVPDQVHPLEQTPPGPGTPPRTRYTPRSRHPLEQTSPLGPGTPPGADTPLGPGTPPLLEQTPPSRHPLGPGTPPAPRSRACWEIRSTCGRSASYWNAIWFAGFFQSVPSQFVWIHDDILQIFIHQIVQMVDLNQPIQ